MGAATHLGINLHEYDAVIRTLIPHYTTLIDEASDAVDTLAPRRPVVVDLGTGSGALAARVLKVRPLARMIGIDEDAGMLAMATKRLRGQLTTIHDNFERAPLPACDVVSASFSLHHIRTVRRKGALYRRVFRALRPGGLLVSADCCLVSDPRLQAAQRRLWMAELQRHYTRARSAAFLRAWAKEDVYFTLAREVELLTAAGFVVDVTWRKDSFAVIVGRKPTKTGR